ncbi:hypothetical protein M422DRAFT_65512 [Sphaerobolus stellatus SS14]|nr:hypothetical protein M422DRAFT_65512 [Sphaerobolus stellatus SS14]
MSGTQAKVYTLQDVEKHNKDGDLWVVIDAIVYDLSKFAKFHPGGVGVLLDEEVGEAVLPMLKLWPLLSNILIHLAGQDATETFFSLHRQEVLEKPRYARFRIGTVEGEKPTIKAAVAGEISRVPYAEPTWLTRGYYSPYYNESHKRLQHAFRKFVDEIITPDALAREEDGKRPSQSVMDAMAEQNIFVMRFGPGKHLKGLTLMNGVVKPEEFNYMHELILNQEGVRHACRGYLDGLLAGGLIGLPPVLNFGKPELQKKVVPEVLQAKKFICLAISEALAGSDVNGIRTTATKTPDGKHWIVNGTKKWITNGMYADYFTTACKTQKGMTVILVERGEGVETKPIKTSYSPTASTAYVTFDNVKVPVENTLGAEDGGLAVVLSNFNHERWVMCCSSIAFQRIILKECMLWVNQRKVFGRPLVSQAVVRAKLASMISRVESAQNWLESLTYQMDHMDYKQQSDKLAGQIALLKQYATLTAQQTAEEAVQIFGGRGITKTGLGRVIEHYHRVVPFDAILGGAENVLADLGVRQAVRKMPKDVRL